MNEQLILELIERVRTRAFGKYRGTVTDVDGKTLRIKAMVPAVLGEQATGWCRPCVPYAGPGAGFAFLPEVGAGVWIEFEAGDVSYPVWTGCYWRDDEQPPDATDKVKVIVTAGGNKLLLDDDAGSITIEDANGNKITLDSSGITLSRGASKVVLSDSSVSIDDGAFEVQ